ncbi:MAG TPA: hypothetical protein VI233_08730 [Puia sp.]
MKRRNFIAGFGCLGLGARGLEDWAREGAAWKGFVCGDSVREEGGIMISVKVIKSKAAMCSAAPGVEVSGSEWSFRPEVNDHGDFYGENLREVYFNLESSRFSPGVIRIRIPGAVAARVIVGYTDVLFVQDGDVVQFHLVEDLSRGQLMQMMYQSPWGGQPIAFIHNWGIRKAREYALQDFPEVEFAAVHNYLLAAQEVLRQAEPKGFKGDIVLMGSEVAATRGHMDYPAHIHIMHYEFRGEKEWVSRLVPHFYMDKQGNITRNKYEVVVGKGDRSKEYGPGEQVRFVDSSGTFVMDLTIGGGGIVFGLAGGRRYSIRPDPQAGAASAVLGYLGDQVICKASVRDYPDIGVFRIQLQQLDKGKVVKTLNDGYLYDPFVPHKLRDLYETH